MKWIMLCFTLNSLITFTHAQDAPRGAFFADEYEAAKAKAMATGKPIAIVITHLNSSCPKCVSANAEVFKEMRSGYILVIDDDEAKKGQLPKQTKQTTYPIYKSKGNTMPIVAILSPSDERLLGGLCYDQISKDSRKAFKTLETELAASATGTTPIQKKTEQEITPDTGVIRDWTNTDGKTIRAELLSSDETHVRLKLESGKAVDYPLENLSEASRKLVEEISQED